jgi:glycosyltransferase involved in cell wall biosynthesis
MIEVKEKKVVVVMPAYNAEKTLRNTFSDIPMEKVNSIILVDDGSTDGTINLAKQLKLKVFAHKKNYGYGANQKTCYIEALKESADIVVMLHPDYQYDPKLLPEMIKPIEQGEADMVLGSRLLVDNALISGMPWWKYIGNKALTALENLVLEKKFAEYHTGYRSYSRKLLASLPFQLNSDKFVFDQEIIFQAVHNRFHIVEIPVPTRYFPEASSASFVNSVVYGFGILKLIAIYLLNKSGLLKLKQFEVLAQRYEAVE